MNAPALNTRDTRWTVKVRVFFHLFHPECVEPKATAPWEGGGRGRGGCGGAASLLKERGTLLQLLSFRLIFPPTLCRVSLLTFFLFSPPRAATAAPASSRASSSPLPSPHVSPPADHFLPSSTKSASHLERPHLPTLSREREQPEPNFTTGCFNDCSLSLSF